ncbi:MAG: transpeptidase family protein [Muribaculaceae bacterium]|nr:transpeptidase family protein [Muribaculaceae bacterium]
MAQKGKNNRTILTRYLLVSFLIIAFAGTITVFLFRNTVLDAPHWNSRAQEELMKTRPVFPERGDILAADGSTLASNKTIVSVWLDYRSPGFASDTLRKYLDPLTDSMAMVFPHRSKSDWARLLTEQLDVPQKKDRKRVLIARDIDYDVFERMRHFPFLKMKNKNKSGFVHETRRRRSHPYGMMASRSIGSVGMTETSTEIHGKTGLECALDSLLYGKKGVARKRNVTRNIKFIADTPAVDGFNIRTTIDVTMQDIVENELATVLEEVGAEWGVAILMEVKTGEIRAISNLERSKNGRYIEAMNRAVQGYEPGSVMKPISMLLALENGLASNLEKVYDIGSSYAYAGGRPITDSHTYGSLTLRGIIAKSSNIGMTKVVCNPNFKYHQDPREFRKSLEEIGFFEPFNLGIAGERVPRVPETKSRVALSRMCYGYSTEIPPVYTLAMYNAIANDGVFVKPRLVSQMSNKDTVIDIPVSNIRDRICSVENAVKLRTMLRDVVLEGTARRLQDTRVAIAGKTGTCYTVNPDTRQYDKARKRLAFCGFFPYENPKYSCMVLTYYPTRERFGAAATSGDVLKNIALKMYARGMLDNNSDYSVDSRKGDKAKVLLTSKPENYDNISSIAGIDCGSMKVIAPSKPDGHVPNVVGLSLREAIVMLESHGFNVAVKGSGYIASQNPAAGTPLRQGATVTLSPV